LFQRISVIANEAAAQRLEEEAVATMAFDLNDATADLEVFDVCVSALLQRRHPSKTVARFIDRAIEAARQQRSAWP
jgi:menaquinone-dependent protoporphyrinogen IX oxidase